MKRILTLTRVMMKSGSNNLLPEKKKKLTMVGIGFIVLYLAAIVGVFSHLIIDTFNSFSQAGLSIYLLLSGTTLYLLLICFIMIPSIYYFSQDIQRFLVLPITPREFMAARFLSTLSTIYATLAIVYIPFGIVYLNTVGFSLSFVIYYILVGIFIPLVPLILSIIVITIAFTFIPFFRNKNLFTYITSGLALLGALWINFSNMSDVDPDFMIQSLITGIQTGTNTLVNVINTTFPQVKFFIDALVNNDPLALLLGIVVSVVAVVLGLYLIQGFYIKSALSIQEESSSKKKLSDSKLEKTTRRTSPIVAIMKIDLKNILRTPIFAMNYFVILLIVPIILIFPLMREGGFEMIGTMLPTIQEIISTFDFATLMAYAVCGGFLVSFFFGSLGTMASTAISREGQAMSQYKLMPIGLIDVVNAKVLLSVICMSIPTFVLVLLLAFFLKINPLIAILTLIAILLGSLVSSLLNIILDVYKPKLDWVTEQQAVKQNYLSMIPMLTIFALAGLFFALIFKVKNIIAVLIGYSIGILIFGVILHLLIRKMCQKRLPGLIS